MAYKQCMRCKFPVTDSEGRPMCGAGLADSYWEKREYYKKTGESKEWDGGFVMAEASSRLHFEKFSQPVARLKRAAFETMTETECGSFVGAEAMWGEGEVLL